MSYIRKSLSEICEIRSGYTARTRLEPAASGGVPAIQLRELRGEREFDTAKAVRLPLGSPVVRYLAGPGDVLFRSRGERNTAVLINPRSKESAVAILPLIVLRPNRDIIDPRYLAWAINQPAAQRYFDKRAFGTNIRMIPKAVLEDLELELPDLGTQRLITELEWLARRERELTHELADRKLELMELALLERAREPRSH
jgi:hypothetical protein